MPTLDIIKLNHRVPDAALDPASSLDLPSETPPTVSQGPTPLEGSRHVGYVKPAKAHTIMVYLTLVTFMTSTSTGLITTGIPTMARELDIPPQTMYWPLSVYSPTTGTYLIVAGTVADVVGSKNYVNREFGGSKVIYVAL